MIVTYNATTLDSVPCMTPRAEARDGPQGPAQPEPAGPAHQVRWSRALQLVGLWNKCHLVIRMTVVELVIFENFARLYSIQNARSHALKPSPHYPDDRPGTALPMACFVQCSTRGLLTRDRIAGHCVTGD